MINIVLCGDPEDTKISKALKRALQNHGVSYTDSQNLNPGKNIQNQIIIYEFKNIPNNKNMNGILVLKNSFKFKKNQHVQNNFLTVINSENQPSVYASQVMAKPIITCGNSAKNTISLSSFSYPNILISVQRNIKSLNNKLIEPHDFNVSLTKELDIDTILFVSSILLLSGILTSDNCII